MIPSRDDWEAALRGRHGDALHEAFSAASVAVCGLGGLGSNIAIALARAGVGRLSLIDFDSVDITNLHRQQYLATQIGTPKPEALAQNLRAIAPYVEVTPITTRVTSDTIPHLLGGVDVVCEAFDSAEAKAMLVDGVVEHFPNAYLVAGSGMAGMGSPNSIRTRRLTSRFYLCGDGVSDVSTSMGLVAPRVMLCAAHQAHTVLRLIAGAHDIDVEKEGIL